MNANMEPSVLAEGGTIDAACQPHGATAMELTVNGEVRQVVANPKTPLLFVLRNQLDLKAAKFGCGLGLCGACYVWLDGHPTQSCDVPVGALEHTDIRTLEGMETQTLQDLFVELQAGQCGYCLSGILVSATALLKKGRRFSREEIARALDKNLCRCGTHGRIVEAVYRAQQG
jgi:nicotinate dehydrogenase subunit A